MNLDFLKNVVVETPETVKTPRVAKDKNPTGGLILRVFKSGKVYPSEELVQHYDLQYKNRNSSDQGYALDVFSSKNWAQFPADAPENYIFINSVRRGSPKADLFASCGYDDNGEPKSDVMTQGGGSFGKSLVEMVESTLNITIEDYVDLTVDTSIAIPSSTGVYYLPKVVSRGENKGKIDAVRRENVVINPVILSGPQYSTQDIEDAVIEDANEVEETPEAFVTETTEDTLTPDMESEDPVQDNAVEELDVPEIPSAPEMPSMPEIQV